MIWSVIVLQCACGRKIGGGERILDTDVLCWAFEQLADMIY